MKDKELTEVTGSVHGDNKTQIESLNVENVNISIDASTILKLEQLLDKFIEALKACKIK